MSTAINSRPAGAVFGARVHLAATWVASGIRQSHEVSGILTTASQYGCTIRDDDGTEHGYYAWDARGGIDRTWTIEVAS